MLAVKMPMGLRNHRVEDYIGCLLLHRLSKRPSAQVFFYLLADSSPSLVNPASNLILISSFFLD